MRRGGFCSGDSGQHTLHFLRSGATCGNRFSYFHKNGLFYVLFLVDLSFFDKDLKFFQGEHSGMITSNEGIFFEEWMVPRSQDHGTHFGGTFFGGNVDHHTKHFGSDPDQREDRPQMPCFRTVRHEKRVSRLDHGSLKTSSKNDSSRASSRIPRTSELFFPRIRRILSTEISPLTLFDVSFHSGRS